jgi:hypothetical protein
MAGVSLMALDDVIVLLVRKADVRAISYTRFSISIQSDIYQQTGLPNTKVGISLHEVRSIGNGHITS